MFEILPKFTSSWEPPLVRNANCQCIAKSLFSNDVQFFLMESQMSKSARVPLQYQLP